MDVICYASIGQHRAHHPEGCFVAEIEGGGGGGGGAGGGDIVGYIISGPARLEDCPLEIIPADGGGDSTSHGDDDGDDSVGVAAAAETIYLHDVCVSPAARQFGVGKRLLATVEALAVKLDAPSITLTAVAGAWDHWSRLGWVELARKSTAAVAKPGQPGLLSEAAVARLRSNPDALGDVRFMRRAR